MQKVGGRLYVLLCLVPLIKALAEMIKKLCIDDLSRDTGNATSIEAFTACQKKTKKKPPGLRPIGVGEVLGRIAGKAIMRISKNDVMRSVGPLQLCASQDAGAEAAIHAMHDIFKNNESEAVLLIDAENTFNSINRKAMIHNISIILQLVCLLLEVKKYHLEKEPPKVILLQWLPMR